MTIQVLCVQCSEDCDKNIFMSPIGSLAISKDKTQSQEYRCPLCYGLVQICVNTLTDTLYPLDVSSKND